MVIEAFITEHLGDDVAQLALQRRRFTSLSDDDFRWALQQIEARQRLHDKLPSLVAMPDFWFPVRLSCEQCSSSLTAQYKADLVKKCQLSNGFCQSEKCQLSIVNYQLVDLTGGLGVDTLYLSCHFTRTDYVERDPELCRLARHNFALPAFASRNISVHNTTAEDFIKDHLSKNKYQLSTVNCQLIYLDPARRDAGGAKVFRLSDCTPDVTRLLAPFASSPLVHSPFAIMLKLSPMLDITSALRDLSAICTPWQVHILSVRDEVKEVLLFHVPDSAESSSEATPAPADVPASTEIIATDLVYPWSFRFTLDEERSATIKNINCQLSIINYIYEPAAAILKAGAFRLIAQRFGLQKLDPNTHLYASDNLIPDFPGRIFRLSTPLSPETLSAYAAESKKELSSLTKANVLVRNYPLSADQLCRKLHLQDGGDTYVIGTRLSGRPLILTASRLP